MVAMIENVGDGNEIPTAGIPIETEKLYLNHGTVQILPLHRRKFLALELADGGRGGCERNAEERRIDIGELIHFRDEGQQLGIAGHTHPGKGHTDECDVGRNESGSEDWMIEIENSWSQVGEDPQHLAFHHTHSALAPHFGCGLGLGRNPIAQTPIQSNFLQQDPCCVPFRNFEENSRLGLDRREFCAIVKIDRHGFETFQICVEKRHDS